MALANSFEYVVSQILNRRCVPVAGAGISLSSGSSHPHPQGHKYHDVNWMIGRLQDALLNLRIARYDEKNHGPICSNKKIINEREVKQGCLIELQQGGHSVSSVGNTSSGCFFCDVISAAKNKKLGNLAELFLWESNSDEDDISCSKGPYVRLIELLKISEYQKLEPTPAHLIIAKLSREGFIREVITTNYDCNFEKAYTRITGNDSNEVIASLDKYRKHGGASNGTNNNLKIFKVNGCAKQLGDGTDEEQCKRILLTERQLQQWRNRQWAADIFKDRLRCNTLFFNGFGSEEPQIHHTLQTVLDEYCDDSVKGESNNVFDTPTAPIVAIYEPHPSFHQQQIVKTYAFQHGLEPEKGDKLIIRNPKQGQSLTADELWKSIFERIYRQLLINALEYSIAPANASFTAIVPQASTLLGEILTTFENTVEFDRQQDANNSHFTSAPDWLNSLKQLCGSTISANGIFQAFSQCLRMLKGTFDEKDESANYEPVNENKALMSELMLLLSVLHKNRTDQLIFCQKRGLGISFEKESKSLYVSATPSFLTGSDTTKKIVGSAELVLVVGNAGSCARPQLHRVSNIVGDSTLQPSTMITLGWKHIFQNGRLNSIKSVNKRLLEAVCSPTHFYYENQPSMNNRPYLKRV